jgi:hypothetical protein
MKEKPMQIQVTSAPWWSYGHVWLVLSGPLLVVVASLISVVVAFQGNDTVMQGRDESEIAALRAMQADKDRSLAPAVQARNHAATPEGTTLKKMP